jgi:hypothetical protein
MATVVATTATQLRERVLAAVDAPRDELALTLSRAIQIESVNMDAVAPTAILLTSRNSRARVIAFGVSRR